MKNLKDLTNEELVSMIQKTQGPIRDEAWATLWKKTEKSLWKVFHKHVNDYYKNTMKDDIAVILKTGWVKAVNTYDEKKATGEFVAYASYLMLQQYVMFVRKREPHRIGKSVRHELLDNVISEMSSNSEKTKDSLIQNILKDNQDYSSLVENKILLQEALESLKEHKEDYYDLIMLHYIQGYPQTQIGQMYDYGQSYISRKIKEGIKYLQSYMMIKSKGNINELKESTLNTKHHK